MRIYVKNVAVSDKNHALILRVTQMRSREGYTITIQLITIVKGWVPVGLG